METILFYSNLLAKVKFGCDNYFAIDVHQELSHALEC